MDSDPHISPDAWDAFVAAHPHGHVLQSACWAKFRQDRGWAVRRVVLRDAGGLPVSGAQVLLRSSPLGAFAYVPRGPVCQPDEIDRLWGAVRLAVRGAVVVRAEPAWLDDASTRAVLANAGFVEAAATQPPSTVRVDLTRSEDDLLAAMKSKWRYNVRLAGRHGVEVVEGDEADLATFERLMGATAQRDDFAARSAGYYAAAWRACRGAARLYLARFEGEVLAAIMVFHCGATATYLYGASSNRERQRMPNHLLQWEAMRRAKSEGCRWYDFWGIPDELGRAWTRGVDPNDIPTGAGGLWGVWNFKRGFGGEVVRTVGAWDDVLRPGRYRMAQLALAIRDRFKAAR